MTRAWQWEEAGQALARSIDLNPNDAQRRMWYCDWLAIHGRQPEAAVQARAAAKLAPDSAKPITMLAMTRFLASDYREAVQDGESATTFQPDNSAAHYWTMRAYMMLDEDISAIVARSRELGAVSRQPEQTESTFRITYTGIHGKTGRHGVVAAWLHEVRQGSPREVNRYYRALWYMWIGEEDKALAELEAAVKSKPYHLIYVSVDPAFAPLRSNPASSK